MFPNDERVVAILINIKTRDFITLEKSPFVIGRLLTSNFVITQKLISRSHCAFEKTEEGWTVVDNSTNGTLVNGELFKRVRSGVLKPHDIVTLAVNFDLEFLLLSEEEYLVLNSNENRNNTGLIVNQEVRHEAPARWFEENSDQNLEHDDQQNDGQASGDHERNYAEEEHVQTITQQEHVHDHAFLSSTSNEHQHSPDSTQEHHNQALNEHRHSERDHAYHSEASDENREVPDNAHSQRHDQNEHQHTPDNSYTERHSNETLNDEYSLENNHSERHSPDNSYDEEQARRIEALINHQYRESLLYGSPDYDDFVLYRNQRLNHALNENQHDDNDAFARRYLNQVLNRNRQSNDNPVQVNRGPSASHSNSEHVDNAYGGNQHANDEGRSPQLTFYRAWSNGYETPSVLVQTPSRHHAENPNSYFMNEYARPCCDHMYSMQRNSNRNDRHSPNCNCPPDSFSASGNSSMFGSVLSDEDLCRAADNVQEQQTNQLSQNSQPNDSSNSRSVSPVSNPAQPTPGISGLGRQSGPPPLRLIRPFPGPSQVVVIQNNGVGHHMPPDGTRQGPLLPPNPPNNTPNRPDTTSGPTEPIAIPNPVPTSNNTVPYRRPYTIMREALARGAFPPRAIQRQHIRNSNVADSSRTLPSPINVLDSDDEDNPHEISAILDDDEQEEEEQNAPLETINLTDTSNDVLMNSTNSVANATAGTDISANSDIDVVMTSASELGVTVSNEVTIPYRASLSPVSSDGSAVGMSFSSINDNSTAASSRYSPEPSTSAEASPKAGGFKRKCPNVRGAQNAGPSCQKDTDAKQNENEEFENELMCSICSELFIKAVTLTCSHTFCFYCIETWKKTKSECPICRADIMSITRTLVLDNVVEKVVEKFSAEAQQQRKSAVEERSKAENMPPPAAPNRRQNRRGQGRNRNYRNRRHNGDPSGALVHSDDSDSDDELLMNIGYELRHLQAYMPPNYHWTHQPFPYYAHNNPHNPVNRAHLRNHAASQNLEAAQDLAAPQNPVNPQNRADPPIPYNLENLRNPAGAYIPIIPQTPENPAVENRRPMEYATVHNYNNVAIRVNFYNNIWLNHTDLAVQYFEHAEAIRNQFVRRSCARCGNIGHDLENCPMQ